MRFGVVVVGDGHLRVVPLDRVAEAVDVWPTAPRPLCGQKTPRVWSCSDCAENLAFLQTACIAVERIQARRRSAENERRRRAS